MDEAHIPAISVQIPAGIAAQLQNTGGIKTLRILSVRTGWAVTDDGALQSSAILVLRRSDQSIVTAVMPRALV